MAFRYSVFSLTLASDRAIPRLRPFQDDGSAPDVEIVLNPRDSFFSRLDDHAWALLRQSQTTDENGESILHVWRAPELGGLFWFAYADGTDLYVSQSGQRIWARWRAPNEMEDTATYLLGPVLGFVQRLLGRLALHASAVVIDGVVVAFAGTGGSGKSTTAAMMAQRGFPVVTDDIVVLRRTDEDGVMVEPDCPILRLWPQSSEFLYGSPDALPRLSETWDKRFLDLETRGYPVARGPQSLGAVYVLDGELAKGDAPELVTLDGPRALLALLANAYCPVDPNAEMRAAEFDVLTRLVGRIRVRRLRQPASPVPPAAVCDMILADLCLPVSATAS